LNRDRVVSVDVVPVDVPLVDPFVISRGVLSCAECGFVRVTLEDGTAGYGEIAPFAALTGETRDSSVAAARGMGGALAGEAASHWEAIAARLAASHPGEPAARAGIECALVDATARAIGIPLFEYLGAADVRERTTDITIPILDEARIDELAARWYGRGFRVFKLKVGINPDGDARRLERLAGRFQDAAFILDANQGFDPIQAVSFARSLAPWRDRILMIEQPVPREDIAGLAAVRQASPVPVAADEAVFSLADARRVIDAGAADIVNLKIMKSGFAETHAIARAVREAGLRLMIGGMMETRLAMAFSYAVVLGIGGIEFLDLDTPLLLASDPHAGGFQYDGPRLSLWPEPGVGATPQVVFPEG
jgi:o-succinylbenzoate synthase